MRVGDRRRDRRVGRVGVDREQVERRLREPAPAERRAEVLDEPGRRVGLAQPVRLVVAARRQRPADHRDRAATPSSPPDTRSRAARSTRSRRRRLRRGRTAAARSGSSSARCRGSRTAAPGSSVTSATAYDVKSARSRGRQRRVAGERIDRHDRPDAGGVGRVDRVSQPVRLLPGRRPQTRAPRPSSARSP